MSVSEIGVGAAPEVAAFRRDLCAWLDRSADRFRPFDPADAGLDAEVSRMRANQAVLYEAGWSRFGWPEVIGGRGGPAMLRAAMAEEVIRRGLLPTQQYTLVEILTPAVTEFAPEIAAQFAPRFLSGQESWCQGFSEPEAGSDLAALRCRAEEVEDGWIVTGEKIWTSFAQHASRIVLLARTGTLADRHRGISAFMVDMDSPGLHVRPLPALNGDDTFSQVSFDGVRVPKERIVGEVGGGWAVAMRILRSERGVIFWMESGWLHDRLVELAASPDVDERRFEAVGAAYSAISALRARSWSTQHAMEAGAIRGPETSVDKILMAAAEQRLFDLIRSSSPGLIEFGDDPAIDVLRSEFMYSRAASIYGGAAEIQRNIVSDQLLSLRDLS